MNFGLKDKTIAQIRNVLAKYSQIEKVILYGSRAKGNFKNNSDIDLTLIGTGLSLTLLNKIRIELDDLLLPYSFDISNFNQISDSDLIDHVERVGIVFYTNEPEKKINPSRKK